MYVARFHKNHSGHCFHPYYSRLLYDSDGVSCHITFLNMYNIPGYPEFDRCIYGIVTRYDSSFDHNSANCFRQTSNLILLLTELEDLDQYFP